MKVAAHQNFAGGANERYVFRRDHLVDVDYAFR